MDVFANKIPPHAEHQFLEALAGLAAGVLGGLGKKSGGGGGGGADVNQLVKNGVISGPQFTKALKQSQDTANKAVKLNAQTAASAIHSLEIIFIVVAVAAVGAFLIWKNK